MSHRSGLPNDFEELYILSGTTEDKMGRTFSRSFIMNFSPCLPFIHFHRSGITPIITTTTICMRYMHLRRYLPDFYASNRVLSEERETGQHLKDMLRTHFVTYKFIFLSCSFINAGPLPESCCSHVSRKAQLSQASSTGFETLRR